MTNKYDDIINLPHHVSKTRPQMPIGDRAAQFSPFAALTGHDDAVKETARLTEERIELDESMKDALNHKLQIIAYHIKDKPHVEITYYKPDEMKEGGAYVTASGAVKKIDEYQRIVIMDNSIVIPIDDIANINGEIFEI